MSNRRGDGFSLLEVLVAFAILAISLGVLMQIFSSSLRNADVTRDQAQAIALAQSLISGTGIETPLVAGETTGVLDERLFWRVRVTPFQGDVPGGATSGPVALQSVELWELTVEVSWDRETSHPQRSVSLSTLRIQAPIAP